VSCQVGTSDGITSVGKVEWLGETEHDARDLLGGGQEADERTERGEAVKWLDAYLRDQPGQEAPAGEVIKAGEEAGFPKHTVQRARKRAGVNSRKSALPRGEAQGTPWVWALPAKTIDGEDDKPTKVTPKVTKVAPVTHVHEGVSPSLPSLSPSTQKVATPGPPPGPPAQQPVVSSWTRADTGCLDAPAPDR